MFCFILINYKNAYSELPFFYVFRKIWLIMKYFKKTMVLIYYI